MQLTNALQMISILIEEPLDAGCVIDLSVSDGVLHVDLNTNAKSACRLQVTDSGIIAYRRYDRIDKVESYEHLVDLVHECGHGRSYFHEGWLNVFENEGLSNPCGDY